MIPRIDRFPENPLLSPEQVKPSREGWEVAGILNCGAIVFRGEVLLLARVAERPRQDAPDELWAPIYLPASDPPRIEVLRVKRDDPEVTAIDARWFIYRRQMYLTSISHLRVCRSRDGRHFEVEEHPALEAQSWDEAFGVEDPRITVLEGQYVIAYTAVSEHGIATALATTRDFHTFDRHGLIFAPENRDVTVFPEKIGGRYACHHRAVPRHIGGFDMWAAYSPDLVHWGGHARVMGPRPGTWDAGRIGGGAVPFRTEQGWLAIYHGADEKSRYALGAVLLDPEDPARVIARSQDPLLQPEAPYEREGFFNNVVFTCGALRDGDRLTIYYGAADQYVCGAETSVREVMEHLGR